MRYLFVLLILQFYNLNEAEAQNYNYSNLEEFDDYLGERDIAASKYGVKEVLCYRCYPYPGRKDSCVLVTVNKYDTEGRLVEKVEGINVANKEIDLLSSYSYKKNNLLVATKKYFPSALQNEEYRYLFNTDEMGVLTGLKFEKTKDGGVEFSIHYLFLEDAHILKKKYDHKMRLIDSMHLKTPQVERNKSPYDSVVNSSSKTYFYKYDDSVNGKLQVRRIYNTKGKLIENVLFEEDEQSDSILFSKKTIYLYDDRDNLAREIITSIDNNFGAEKKYVYNEAGILVSYFDDSPGMKISIEYDDEGKTTEIKSFDPFSKKTRNTKYSYERSTGFLLKEEIFFDTVLHSYNKYEYKSASK
jgi:hypothetical protein